MVMRWLSKGLLLVGVLLSLAVGANPGRMVPQQVMLGQAVTWVLEGQNIAQHFAMSDLTELKQYFYIERVMGGDDRLRVKLYPYQAGQITLQPIRIGHMQFKPPMIEVSENPDIKVVWQPPSHQMAYQNQVIYWRAKLLADSADFSVTAELVTNSGQGYQWLGTAEKDGRQAAFGHQWRLTSGLQLIQPGNYPVGSPRIWVRNSTQQRWLFVAPPSRIKVQPLPSFIPRNIPVGELQVTAKLPMHLIEKGALQSWRWQWLGQDLKQDDFPDLAESLTAATGVEWLTPSKHGVAEMQLDGLRSKLTIEQPFRVNQYGWVSLPPLRVTYFDVETGKLVDQQLDSSWVIVVPSWFLWLAKGLGWILSLIGLMLVWQLARSAYLKWRLIRQLELADDVHAIWLAIQYWTQTNQAWGFLNENSGRNKAESACTFGAWFIWYEQQYGKNEAAQRLVTALNAVFYGNGDDTLQQRALDWAQELPNLDMTTLNQHQLRRFLARMKQVFVHQND